MARNQLQSCPQCGDTAEERLKYTGGNFYYCTSCRRPDGKSLSWATAWEWDRIHHTYTAATVVNTRPKALWIICPMGHRISSDILVCPKCWGDPETGAGGEYSELAKGPP